MIKEILYILLEALCALMMTIWELAKDGIKYLLNGPAKQRQYRKEYQQWEEERRKEAINEE